MTVTVTFKIKKLIRPIEMLHGDLPQS